MQQELFSENATLEKFSLSGFLDEVKNAFDTFIAYKNFLVEAEIRSIKKVNQFYYFELVELNSDWEIVAKSRASLFNQVAMTVFLRKIKLDNYTQLEGKKIVIQGRANFHKDYWFSINIEKFIAEFFIWEQQLQKQKTIKKLQEQWIFELNKDTFIWYPTFNIAVISSETSEWLRDFKTTLEESKYKFNLDYFYASVHSSSAKWEILKQLKQIKKSQKKYNIIAIIRWWWESSGMYWGNDEQLVREICLSSIPILSAIGHTVDKNIIDEVSKYSAKTPTAWAQVLIEEAGLYSEKLEYLKEDLDYLFTSFLENKKDDLDNIFENINNIFNRNLEKFKFNLEGVNNKILLSLPENIFEKWYSLIFDEKSEKVVKKLKTWEKYVLFNKDGKYEVIINKLLK